MPTYVLRLDETTEEYVTWSTVTDSPTTFPMNRAEMLNHLATKFTGDPAEQMLARADLTGTSCHHDPELDLPPFGHWNTTGFVLQLSDGFYWLPRRNLAAYVHATLPDSTDDPSAHLETI